MKRQFDIFAMWVWFVTDHEIFEFENHEILLLLEKYCAKKHWIEISNDRYKYYLRHDIA